MRPAVQRRYTVILAKLLLLYLGVDDAMQKTLLYLWYTMCWSKFIIVYPLLPVVYSAQHWRSKCNCERKMLMQTTRRHRSNILFH